MGRQVKANNFVPADLVDWYLIGQLVVDHHIRADFGRKDPETGDKGHLERPHIHCLVLQALVERYTN